MQSAPDISVSKKLNSMPINMFNFRSSLRQRMVAGVLVAAVASAIAVAVTSFVPAAAEHHDDTAVVGLRLPLPEDDRKSLEAAAEAGDPEAQFKLANEISLYQGPGIRAFQLYRLAAEQRHPRSEYEMGVMLSGQILVWERDSSEIAKLEAAPPGDVTWTKVKDAEGVSLVVDHIKALHWFEKAAEHGSRLAWSNLATIYKEGRGVKPDPVEAAKWVRKLAEAGEPTFIVNYARRLRDGEGVTPDPIEAFAWSLLLVESAYPADSGIGIWSREIQKDLERKMSSDEISAARLRAKEIGKHTRVCVGGPENCS